MSTNGKLSFFKNKPLFVILGLFLHKFFFDEESHLGQARKIQLG